MNHEIENPMLSDPPTYTAPKMNIVGFDLTDHYKKMREWNEMMGRKSREEVAKRAQHLVLEEAKQ